MTQLVMAGVTERDRAIYGMVRILRAEQPDNQTFGAMRPEIYRWASIKILREMRPSQAVIDQLILEDLSEYAGHYWMCVYNLLRDMVALCKLGASPEVIGQVLPYVLERGQRTQAECLAKLLGRQLTNEEVWVLVRVYLNDRGSRSESDEEAILEFACQYLTQNEVRQVQRELAAKNRAMDNDLY